MHRHSSNRRTFRKALVLGLLALVLVSLASTSFAQDIGTLADNATKSANKLGIALQVIARLIALGFVFGGVFMHYKAHKEKGQGQHSHSLAVVMWLVGGIAFYASSLIHTTGNTLWGTGGGDNSTIQITN